MKTKFVILLFSAVITTCYGQEANKHSNNINEFSSLGVESFGDQSSIGFSGITANDSYLIIRSTLGVGGYSETITTAEGSYVICQSIGQSSVIGTYSNNNYSLVQGFQQPISDSKLHKLPQESDLFANLYPNPFYHYINVSFRDPVKEEITVSLTNIAGKIIFLNRYPATQLVTLKLEHLNAGIYILKISTKNKQFRANIIKQYQ